MAIVHQQNVDWPEGKSFPLKGYTVSLSAPVLVARSKGYLWFPSLARLANGDLLATMSNYADIHTTASTSLNAFSSDGGRTWGEPIAAPYGEVNLRLAAGDELFLPYYLYPARGGMKAPYKLVKSGTREIKVMEEGVLVSGWPRPDRSMDAAQGMCGFVFNGQTVRLKSGEYLATLYGYFENDTRMSVVTAESSDGINWQVRSIIAGPECALEGAEGPCEVAICRLKDGRLMCVFRLASNVPFGQTYSEDEGRTWSPPVAMANAFSVQPSLAVMDNGMVVLSGGRPGLYLWFNADGTGKDWERVDFQPNHNQYCPADRIEAAGNTSSYTEVVALDEKHLLCIYDRTAYGWNIIPPDSPETNSVWVIRIMIEKN
jgi:hypothetical protein